MKAFVPIAAAMAAVAACSASAGVTTTVSLVSQDVEAVRLALPSVEVRVDGPDEARARSVATALAADVAARAVTRAPSGGELASYALAVALPSSEGTIQRFEARLIAANGDVVWFVEGEVRSDSGPVGAADLVSLADNVLAALIRDRWLEARHDPNDPPPPPPIVGRRDR